DPDVRERYEDQIEGAMSLYGDLVGAGIPGEDARFVFPNATRTNLVMTTNLRALIHMSGLRLCTMAQWEIRRLFQLIRHEIFSVSPFLGAFLAPKCVPLGYCDEMNNRDGHCPIRPHKDRVLEAWAEKAQAARAAGKDLLVAERLARVAGAGVRDQREATDLETGPARGDAFHDRRHAHGVTAERGIQPDLGRRLVVRAEQADVDALGEGDALGGSRRVEALAQSGAPGVGHVREPLPDRLGIRPEQRVLAGQVEVVADDHERARPERGVEPARGVREHDHP